MIVIAIPSVQATALLFLICLKWTCLLFSTRSFSSMSKSQLLQRSHFASGSEDGENRLRSSRQWILDVLAADDRAMEARMISFLISKLLASPIPPSSYDGAVQLDSALLAISHLDFLHQC